MDKLTWIWEERHDKAREKLIKVCREALERKDFKRHYYGKNKTHCNRASEYIAKQCGADTAWMHYNFFQWLEGWGKLGCVMTANSICKRAPDMTIKYITRVDQDQARFCAWLGYPVLLCAHTIKGRRSGHVAIVYPTPQNSFLKVCNVGWDNLICSPGDNKSFGGGASYLSAWSFYLLKTGEL